ncbi:MAG: guanylate kinase [Candidatus Omnitrophota bacterium]
MKKNFLIIVSAPSGSGKTTVIQRLLKKDKTLIKSVSATTRAPRRGEEDGVDYHFISREEFKKRIQKGYFLEWEEVFGNYYGTPHRPIQKALKEKRNVVLDLDVKGALKVKKRLQPNVLLIFLEPPSLAILRERLKGRSSDSHAEIRKRLALAAWEMKKKKRI